MNQLYKKCQDKKKDHFYKAFTENLTYFYENEKEKGQNLNLTNLNKKFLTSMLKVIRNESNFIPNQKHISKSENYKIEDIQSERLQTFDKQLTQKKKEFESYSSQKKPPIPNFTETLENDKIRNIDELLAQQMAQRNLDFLPVDNTMIYTKEKYSKMQQNNLVPLNNVLQSQSQNMQQNPIKLIRIQETVNNVFSKNEIVELDSSNIDINNIDENENDVSMNILGKLKVVQQSQNEIDSIMTFFKEKLETLEQKIDEINTNIKDILEKVNSETI